MIKSCIYNYEACQSARSLSRFKNSFPLPRDTDPNSIAADLYASKIEIYGALKVPMVETQHNSVKIPVEFEREADIPVIFNEVTIDPVHFDFDELDFQKLY